MKYAAYVATEINNRTLAAIKLNHDDACAVRERHISQNTFFLIEILTGRS